MGYESRVLIVNVHRYYEDKEPIAETIADVKMSKMGLASGWHELFNNYIDFEVCVDGELTREDKYGEALSECDRDELIAWLEKQIEHDDYRRLPLLLGLIKGIDTNKWEEIHIVHYGY